MWVLFGNNSIVNLVSAQFTTLIAALHTTGGDEEAAWEAVLPLFGEALQQTDATALCDAWQALASRMPELCGESNSVYWLEALARGEEMIQQVALGRLLLRHGEYCAERLGQYFMEKNPEHGVRPHSGQCRRDLGLFIHHLATTLCTQAPTVAALNISRYLMEMIIPFVSYSSATWRLVWLRLEHELRPHANAAEQLALQRWLTQLSLWAEHLPHTQRLGQAVFHATPCFSEDTLTEQHWQAAFSGLLCAALTPEDAPVPGQALAQRLLLASPVFADETVASWQIHQQQINELCAPYLDSRLNALLLVRQAQMIAGLMKLPHLQNAWNTDVGAAVYPRPITRNTDVARNTGVATQLEGLSVFASLLAGLPYAEALWRALQWAHNQSAENIAFRAWPLASPDSQRRAADIYHAACQFRADFPVVWHKWRLGGFLGRIDSNTLTLKDHEQRAIQVFLQRLALQHLAGQPTAAFPPERAFKQHLFLLFWRFSEYLPEQRRALMHHLQQAVTQQYHVGHPLTTLVNGLSAWQVEIDTALQLLTSNVLRGNDGLLAQRLAKQCLPTYPQCAADLEFLFRRIGLHLSGVWPCRNLGEWYWQQIAQFLPETLYAQAPAVFTELLANLPKHLNEAEVKCLEPLLQEIRHVVMSRMPPATPSTAWKVTL